MNSDTPRYMCVMAGCPGEHASKYLCCDFPEHQPGKWVPPLTVNTRGINIGICDATNYRIAWSHFPEYAEAIANVLNQHPALVAQCEALRATNEEAIRTVTSYYDRIQLLERERLALRTALERHVSRCECKGTGRRKGRPAWDPPGKTSPFVEFDCDYCAADRSALSMGKLNTQGEQK